MSGEFVSDVRAIRMRARKHIECGAVPAGDRETVLRVLNDALATEVVGAVRYDHDYVVARDIPSASVADQFRDHAGDEQDHAVQIATRIVQLGGAPNFKPPGLKTLKAASRPQSLEGESLADMLCEDVLAEQIAIEFYKDMIAFVGDKDKTTRTMLEGIAEEHAEEMSALLNSLNLKSKDTEDAMEVS